MKKQVGLIVIGLLLITNGFSQTNDLLIQEIDSTVNSITKISSSCKRTKTHVGATGQASWFREIFQNPNNDIILLCIYKKDSSDIQFVEYFYSGSQVIFIRQTQTDNNENKNIEQFYLYNGQLLEWKESNGLLKDKNSDSFVKVSLELADYAIQLANDFQKNE